jgi:hypothetical protein
VTEEDYARAAEKHPEVRKAVATFRWTGSWHTVFLAIDPEGQSEDFSGARGTNTHLGEWIHLGWL